MEHWTPNEIKLYERAIKLATKQTKQVNIKRKQKLNNLFNRMFNKTKINSK